MGRRCSRIRGTPSALIESLHVAQEIADGVPDRQIARFVLRGRLKHGERSCLIAALAQDMAEADQRAAMAGRTRDMSR